jgi:Peptidase A4 family
VNKTMPTAAIAALLAVLVSTPAEAVPNGTVAADAVSSANHAGYVLAGQGPVHKVTARWVQPTPTCGRGSSYANIQAELAKKTHIFKLGTAVNCRGGDPVAYAWYYNAADRRQRVPRVVNPGDVMRVTVSWYHWEADYAISDVTRHWNLGVGMAGGYNQVPTRASFAVAARSGAEGALPLTDVGTVSFLACWVDGEKITVAESTAVTMTQGRIVKAEPGPIDAGAFSVTWRHA